MEARQTPTFERLPTSSTTTDGPMGTRLASAFFGDPLPWQQHMLDVLLARDARCRRKREVRDAVHAVEYGRNGSLGCGLPVVPTILLKERVSHGSQRMRR